MLMLRPVLGVLMSTWEVRLTRGVVRCLTGSLQVSLLGVPVLGGRPSALACWLLLLRLMLPPMLEWWGSRALPACTPGLMARCDLLARRLVAKGSMLLLPLKRSVGRESPVSTSKVRDCRPLLMCRVVAARTGRQPPEPMSKVRACRRLLARRVLAKGLLLLPLLMLMLSPGGHVL